MSLEVWEGFTIGVEDFLASLTSAGLDEELWGFAVVGAGTEDAGGGGSRPARLLTALLIMVPYVPVVSKRS